MRIALLTTQWPGVRLGGIGAYTQQCAAALAKAGVEVHVFVLPLSKDAREAAPAGVILHEIEDPARARLLPGALPMPDRLKYQMALPLAAHVMAVHGSTPFDLVEGPEYESLAYDLAVAQKIPVVTHLHSGRALARVADGIGLDQEAALLEALELEVIAGADALCAPSRAVVRDTQAAFGLEDLAEGAEILPLPFAAREGDFQLAPDGAEAPVLFVGRLEMLKGAHLLAEAAARFMQEHAAARLRIVGPDTLTAPDDQGRPSGTSMMAWMQQKLAGVAQRVEFLGEKSATDIEEEMRRCAFVVIPSLRESYSYVCCEALAAGRPVVVSRDIGATEVAGEAGVGFSRGDWGDLARAMGGLWRQQDLRAELSRLAWERARGPLAAEHTTRRRIAFYERVVRERQRRGPGEIEGRLLSLPPAHSFRLLVAGAMAKGEADLLPAFLPQAELPAPSLMPIDRLLSQLGKLGAPSKFYLYGAGRHTARLLMEKPSWEQWGHELLGLIDDHPRYAQVPEAYGLPVMSCAMAAETLAAGVVVVLSTDAFEEQFWGNTVKLREKGIGVVRLYT